MRKVRCFALAALVAILASCQPDPINITPSGSGREYRLTSFDNYKFTYNDDGRVASVGDRQFTYSGKTLTISYKDADEYNITLNNAGFATRIERSGHTWRIEYDKSWFISKAFLDGVQCMTQKSSSGNIDYWSRYNLDSDFWEMNEVSYLPKSNRVGIHTIWAESLSLERWLFEAGLLGNAPANIAEYSRWKFGDNLHDKNTSVYDYEYDADGCVVSEFKYYGEWNEFDVEGLRKLETHTFTWEKIATPLVVLQD